MMWTALRGRDLAEYRDMRIPKSMSDLLGSCIR